MTRLNTFNGLRIYIDGLSLFVKTADSIELAYLDPEHQPIEFLLHNEYGREVWPFTPQDVPGKKVKLSIEKKRYTHSVTFGNDFVQMPDLAKWHQGHKVEVDQTLCKANMSAKVVIKDAEFYTAMACRGAALRTDNSQDSLPTTFSNVGRIMGADIVCGPGEEITFNLIDENGRALPAPGPLNEDSGYHMLSIGYSSEKGCVHRDPLHLIYDYFLKPLRVNYQLNYANIEPFWKLNGWVASKFIPFLYFDAKSPLGDSIPDGNRILYSTEQEAWDDWRIGGYKLEPISTAYACQGYGGGDGPLPDIP